MQPIHFGARERPLFGLYEPGHAPRRRLGVVLCNPFGWEYLRAHRTLRILASRLTEAGIDVLRFDWSGTGDSGGDLAAGIDRAQLVADVGTALEELEGMARTPRLALVGLRGGAALAAAAALRPPFPLEHVVLWDPPGVVITAGAPSPFAEVPSAPLRAELEAVEVRPLPGRTRLHLALSDARAAVPEALRAAAASVISVDDSPTCWVEERDFGAGAVPTALLAAIVRELTA